MALEAYEADDSNKPIFTEDYLTLLAAFEKVVKNINVPEAYDTDFRRNLPAGGRRDLQATPSLIERIGDVREFLKSNLVFNAAGKAILDNLQACVHLCKKQNVESEKFLSTLEPVLVKIAAGNLR